MSALNGWIMSENTAVATVKDGEITEFNSELVPLYLKRTRNVEGWLSSRAIDSSRVNSRLLKKAFRLNNASNSETSLFVNAATITDRYWFKPEDSSAIYEDIRFNTNDFDTLALFGDPDGFSKKLSRSPELTNVGSFEKCWRLIDGKWWLYKSGNENELFSELFISQLLKKLGLFTAYHELDGGFIRTPDFTDNASVNFEPMRSLTDNDDDYTRCFNTLFAISEKLAEQYLLLIWADTVCFNMDRHTENFGFLRNVKTGEIISLAPNFDNNIALISRGYPKDKTRKKDGLIKFLREFISTAPEALKMYKTLRLPVITRKMIEECINETPFNVDTDFICEFILNGQAEIQSILK